MRLSELTLESTGRKKKTEVFRFRLCFHCLALNKMTKTTATRTRLRRPKDTSSCLSKSEETRKIQAKNSTNSKKTCSCSNFTKLAACLRFLNSNNRRIAQRSTKSMMWRLFWSWTLTRSMHSRTRWSPFSGCTTVRVHPSTFWRMLWMLRWSNSSLRSMRHSTKTITR